MFSSNFTFSILPSRNFLLLWFLGFLFFCISLGLYSTPYMFFYPRIWPSWPSTVLNHLPQVISPKPNGFNHPMSPFMDYCTVIKMKTMKPGIYPRLFMMLWSCVSFAHSYLYCNYNHIQTMSSCWQTRRAGGGRVDTSCSLLIFQPSGNLSSPIPCSLREASVMAFPEKHQSWHCHHHTVGF